VTQEARVRINNPTGLHARPAVRLAQLASSFDANVHLRVGEDGDWVKAKSTAKVMKLKARANATLHFRAEGEDASDALAALIAFVERNFDEGLPGPVEAAIGPGAGAQQSRSAGLAGESGGIETAFAAEVAAEGLAVGIVHHLERDQSYGPAQGSVSEERYTLERALRAATTELQRLALRSDAMAAEILAFQLELVSDEEFVAPAFERIAGGASAASAWESLMNSEIADYEQAEDAYFEARAGDLRDLRDRVLAYLCGAGAPATVPDNAVLLVDELTPSRFLELDWARLAGAVMRGGSQMSHVAMLARARGVPLLIKLKASTGSIPEGAEALVDAERGQLVLWPDAVSREQYRERMAAHEARRRAALAYLGRLAQTADGMRVAVCINVDDPALLSGVDPSHCDGIGLTRTEFLFRGGAELPDEDTQFQAYRALIDWAQGRPVTIRTLDAGGDKPIPGVTVQDEQNPFLGVRGIRVSLANPEVFQTQLRALARAAAHGPLKVMVPMVSTPAELREARELLRGEVQALARAGVEAAMPAFGMMVEVPAAALAIAEFDADFFSIGTNDLVQYVMAAARDRSELAALQDPLHPAVLELIARVAEHGAQRGVEVSVCGEMASNPVCLRALLEAGIRTLSVPVAALARTKAVLAGAAGER